MKKLHETLPLVAVIAVIGVNAAAVVLPINGYDTAVLSDLNPTGFTPAGYVFSIWSVIYSGLIAFGLSQALGDQSLKARGELIRTAFFVNAATNVAWIFAWHYRLVPLSFALMLVLLGSLIVMFRTLRSATRPDWPAYLTIDGPISIYLGWITVATILNLAALFYDRQFYPFALTMDQWALVSVGAAAAIYAWMGALTRDAIYCAVFVWASYGIFANPMGIGAPVKLIAITGMVAIAAVIAWIVVSSEGLGTNLVARWPRPRSRQHGSDLPAVQGRQR